MSGKLSIRFSSEFLWHLLQLPTHFYSQRYAGEIAYRMTLNDTVVDSLTGSVLFAFLDLILVLFYGVFLFSYDSLIAMVGIGTGVLNIVAMLVIFRMRANDYARLQQDLVQSLSQSIIGLQHIESIKAKAAESTFFSKWAGLYTKTVNARQGIGTKDVLLSTLPVFVQFFTMAALLGIGSFRIVDGSLTVGMLMALQVLLTNFLAPISRFVGLNQLLQNMQIDVARLDDVLKNPVDSRYKARGNLQEQTKTHLKGKLEFRNVTFGYNPLAPPLVENLSFVIAPGRKLGIVGPTGSGKSTVAKLAANLFHPWSGEILYDDIPFDQVPRETMLNSMASVDQDIFLFSGSIRDNICLWNEKVPDEIIIKAAKDAAIHEEILLTPKGYETVLLEGGKNMSGGQRQRIEIARALLYHPTLLILDEITTALDSPTELYIIDRIRERGCSALMIAHRLSTIQDCDEILVLDRGKVVQRGTHDALKKAPGVYQNLLLSEIPE